MSKLKIGFLLDSEWIDGYALDLLDWASRQDDLELAAVIVHPAAVPRLPWRQRLRSAAAARLLGLVVAVERPSMRRFKAHRAHLARFRLAEAVAGARIVRLAPPADGQPDPAIPRIGIGRLDLLVAPGPGPASGLTLTARLGTIALDYRGKRASPDAPPGFWEAYHKAKKTGFEITHYAGDGRPAQVIASGAFPTKYLFLLNQANLYRNAFAQLKRLLATIAASGEMPPHQPGRPYSGPHFGQPQPLHSAAWLAKLASRLAAKACMRLFNIQDKWGLSWLHSGWRGAALWNSTRIAAPRGHFWADPFLCPHEGKTYCFVEDYVYKTRLGHIAVLEIGEHGARLLGDCIKEDFHMSFPFLFRYKGELYMCPESSQARQIRQYRCTAFPLEWELHAVAMDGISAADTMFFEHGGKWWMLTNIDRSGLNDHCFELCLFHAGSPFDRDWAPHPQNPLRIDPDGGRNAGLILEGGKIFRAAQRQGFDRYGEGLMLYEIVHLDEHTYTERPVAEIDCGFRPGLLGSHHVSTTGEVTVFDHVSRCFFP